MKACIFDLDGTIIYTIDSIKYSVNEAIVPEGLPPITDEETMAFIGNGTRELMVKVFGKYQLTDEAKMKRCCDGFDRIFAENCTRDNRAYEGMQTVLETLKADGIRLGVLSNKPDPRTKECVRKVYGDNLFDAVYGARDEVPMKPDPAGILEIMKEFGVTGEETLYIGDGDTDMISGKAAGCHTVAVLWGYRSEKILQSFAPEHVIRTPEEILNLIDKSGLS